MPNETTKTTTLPNYNLGLLSAIDHQLLMQLMNLGCKSGLEPITKHFGVDHLNATVMVAGLIQKIASAPEVAAVPTAAKPPTGRGARKRAINKANKKTGSA